MRTYLSIHSNYSLLSPAIVVLLAMLLARFAVCSDVVVNNPVIPGGLADHEGNSAIGEPFSLGGQGNASLRMQQVYAASEFYDIIGPTGGWIYDIGFRADGNDGLGVYDTDIPNLQIRLSVTDRGPDGLSPVFEENVGSSPALVVSGRHSAGVIALGFDPEFFTMGFTFSQPYFYDPRRGNLLLDVINIGGGPLVFLDAVDTVGDGVSRVVYKDFGTQIPPSGTVDTIGLVTRFTIVPVPEPSTWALLGIGAVILAWCHHSTSRRRTTHVID